MVLISFPDLVPRPSCSLEVGPPSEGSTQTVAGPQGYAGVWRGVQRDRSCKSPSGPTNPLGPDRVGQLGRFQVSVAQLVATTTSEMTMAFVKRLRSKTNTDVTKQ